MISRRRIHLFLLFAAIASRSYAQPVAADPEAKPYIGMWAGKETPELRLPAPRLKIRKDGTGAYYLGNPDKPLYEFKWEMGEDQLQAAVNDGERFFAAIIRPDGKLVWRQAKLRPGVKTDGIEFEKVPSDF
jgi:hypothetical protein